MFDKRILFAGLALAFILSACAGGTGPTEQPMPTLSSEWTITLTQSGGIMGLLRTIEISSNGKVHAESNYAKQKTVESQLSPDQLAKLTELINSSKLNPPPKGPNATCADCFNYNLQVTSGGKPFSVQLNDISLPGSGMEALVNFLIQLMDQLLR